MKKLQFLFAVLFMVAAFVSCNLQENSDLLTEVDDVITFSVAIDYDSSPESDAGIIPVVLSGTANRGGNVTCAEVAEAFGTSFALCGDRISYEDYDGDLDYEFVGFPEGLNVEVDGNFISFSMSNCLQIEGNYYKVGAVIVKGADAANVYYYLDGTVSDAGLAAPYALHMVSNLTFCFIPCEQPEWIIALKTYLKVPGMEYAYAVSGGTGSATNALYMGYNSYIPGSTNVYPLLFMWSHEQVGTITATDYWENDIHYLEVVIDTDDDTWLFKESFLYVGTLEGYNTYQTPGNDEFYITNYNLFPFYSDELLTDIRTFKIPFDEITE